MKDDELFVLSVYRREFEWSMVWKFIKLLPVVLFAKMQMVALDVIISRNKHTKGYVLNRLFCDEDKYLIKRAIDDRIDKLDILKIESKWLDKENADDDINRYKTIQGFFSSDLWK